MINNRQNGRRRGRGGQRVGGVPGRPESGNRIDNRARGNASQLHEKYKTLASDAQRQGDRVNTEYYLQFADHYFRVLAESRPRADEQQARARGRDEFDDDFDGDGEDYGQEGESGQPDQYQQPRADDRGRQDGRQVQDERPRQQAPRQDERPRRDERPRQEERPRRDDRVRRDGAQEQRPREDRPRDEQRPRAERAPERGYADADEPVDLALPVDEVANAGDDQFTPHQPGVQEASTPRAADMDAPLPRRRGRPPKVRTQEPVAEAEPAGFDADRLPPSLSISASAEPDSLNGGEAEKPRRRRRLAAEPAEVGPAS